MSPQFETPPWYKIHENCGGLVRWREAVETPGVGYTGECNRCTNDSIVIERIIPLYDDLPQEISLFEVIQEVDKETLADLRWDEQESNHENQRRLKRTLIAAAGYDRGQVA